jgi:hypothetical protein
MGEGKRTKGGANATGGDALGKSGAFGCFFFILRFYFYFILFFKNMIVFFMSLDYYDIYIYIYIYILLDYLKNNKWNYL